MPYRNLSDLPQSVTAHLPRQAQELYLAAYNRILPNTHILSGDMNTEYDSGRPETRVCRVRRLRLQCTASTWPRPMGRAPQASFRSRAPISK